MSTCDVMCRIFIRFCTCIHFYELLNVRYITLYIKWAVYQAVSETDSNLFYPKHTHRTSEENFYSADEKYKFVHTVLKADGEFTIMTLYMQSDEVVDLKANNIKLSNLWTERIFKVSFHICSNFFYIFTQIFSRFIQCWNVSGVNYTFTLELQIDR